MILHGNQRGGARDLALHLLKDENDHVEVHDLRGFVGDDLLSAFKEVDAISRGTRCKQFLYSLSLNPPPGEKVSTPAFLEAIERSEKTLGLNGQPRAIVFHEKNGRRHAHCVWSRIDARAMKAVHLPHTKRKLMELSRSLYLEHGWQMPEGMLDAKKRDPKNFTMAQWQQGRRTAKDPREIKGDLQGCWARSDSQSAFQQALKDQGYVLARGDRRGFVVLDYACEVYALPKWLGIKTKQVRERLDAAKDLPSVDEAKASIARDMSVRLKDLQAQRNEQIAVRMSELERKKTALVQAQQQERSALGRKHQQRQEQEALKRHKRFNAGWRGLWDRLTGHRRKIKAQNEYETFEALRRDQREKDTLVFAHLEQRQTLQKRMDRLLRFRDELEQDIGRDIERYEDIRARRREHFERQATLRRSSNRQYERSRDGPDLER